MARRQKRNKSGKIQEGVIKRHPDGFGFFIPDSTEDPDVYIPRKSMMDVMTNDRVEVEVFPEPGGSRFRGHIRRVLHRATSIVTGHYVELDSDIGLLMDKSFAWGGDISVDNPNNYSVKDGMWVSVRIKSYPGDPNGFCGDIVSVIEDVGDPLNDPLRVLASAGIPHQFSAAVIKESETLPEEVRDIDRKGRIDLTDRPFITIDGQTAKDFDDAILVEMNSSGFHLVVAIADVSHYVKPGSDIDREAYDRGTSTYFPNFVSPMLPEKLSNGLCSLKPNVDRLALVADMDISFQGEVLASDFYEAVIRSHARVTYGQAQEVIEGQAPAEFEHVKENILRAADLAKLLMAKRFKEGSLNLEIPETEIEVDETGEPVDIMQSERLFSHKLIEEMMLMANVAVARYFTRREIPALYRIHEDPDPEAIEALNAFLKVLGSQKQVLGGKIQKKITRALEEFQGHPKEHILNMLTLRSMAQAKYSADNIGHFGLGFKDYCHFTSPIRRYPDLIVHRLLKAAHKISGGYELVSEAELETAGTVLSACEQRSVKAERQIHSIKKARFMRKFLGEEFDGTISSVTKFGLFVILRQYDVDGLVHIEELESGLKYDEENMRLFSKKTGIEYHIGDPIRIVVASANIDEGRIDFTPVRGEKMTHGPQTSGEPAQKRSSSENHRQRLRKARVSGSRRKGKAR